MASSASRPETARRSSQNRSAAGRRRSASPPAARPARPGSQTAGARRKRKQPPRRRPSKPAPALPRKKRARDRSPPGEAQATGRRLDPKYAPLLVPAIMAIAMSFVMSLVQTIARLGFTPNLASAWLTSFAIGAAVAIPTAILVAPRARRLAGHLTATPRNSPPGNRQQAGSR